MPQSFQETLKKAKILQEVKTRPPVLIEQKTPIEDVLSTMRAAKRGSALIVNKKKLVGIFTERDFMTRVIQPELSLSLPIHKVMTANPICLQENSSISEAIALMSESGCRHIPLVDKNKNVKALISVRDLLHFLAEHFPYEIMNLPPNPNQINKDAEGA